MDRSVRGTTSLVGVLAYPVHHTKSPALHNAAFEALGLDFIYVPFNVPPEDLETAVQAVRALGMVGVNITIPHKEQVIGYLDWVSEAALQIRSVNTIHNAAGTLKGYSTDGPGFILALEREGKSPDGSRAVILGAGGAARATASALVERGATVTVANRTLSRGVEMAEMINSMSGKDSVRAVALSGDETQSAVREADLLVNCTSVGMYPDSDAQPIPSEWMHSGLFVYDQIYNPSETSLLRAARQAGARGANGVGMLVFQGALSFEIWTGLQAPIEAMESAVLGEGGK